MDLPPFEDFYRAVHGYDPFPWQERLAQQVLAGGWPEQIAVPTGLGKTSCIDIAIWTLASRAEQPPEQRSLPTRIWYVVNRRLLVDSAYDQTHELAALLRDPSAPAPLRAVAERLDGLGAMGSESGPLHVCRLRGGVGLDSIVPDPSHPTVYFATVPMYASRLLFRGYGASRAKLPVEAAHAGVDALVLVDEAHLVRPLVRLVDDLTSCDIGDPTELLPESRARPVLVALTATGEGDRDSFDLDVADRQHPVISERLHANKDTRLVPCDAKSKLKTMVDQTVDLLGGENDAALVVFVNTPREARTLYRDLGRRLQGRASLELLTGQIRDWDAGGIRARLLAQDSGAPAMRSRDVPREGPLVVVATQTLEVGADLDFDLLVTESAGARSLVQRFGRLNRLGMSPHGRAAICHPTDQREWPVYGEEPRDVWARLTADGAESRSLTSDEISEAVGDPQDVPPRTGVLHSAHLWEWAKTSMRPAGEAPVNLFFEGFDEGVPRVFVAWRAHHPAPGQRLRPAIRSAEVVELGIGRVREALSAREIESVARVDHEGAGLEPVRVNDIRPGDQLVLHPEDGLYDDFGWNPDSDHPVQDVSGFVWGGLLLDDHYLANLLGGDPDGSAARKIARELVELEAPDDAEFRDAESELLDRLKDELGTAQPASVSLETWRGFVDGLGSVVERPPDAAPHVPPAHRGSQVRVRHDAFDELSFEAGSRELSEHLGAVGDRAREVATRVGLPPSICTALEAAGELHDGGKADRRFQLWLAPQGADAPLAKSTYRRTLSEGYRRAAGWPRGGRHELLSARLASELLGDRENADLIVHLIHAHHGGGRPMTQVAPDDVGADLKVSFTFDGREATVPAALDRPDLRHPGRFRSLCERYGFWGLALLESCLKQADHAVSAAEEVL